MNDCIKLGKIVSTSNRYGVVRASVQLIMEVEEVINDVILRSEWGENANPPAGTPCIVLILDSEYSKQYALPFNLDDAIRISSGEKIIYTSDNTKIYLKENGDIDIIASDDDKKPSINITASTALNITAPAVNIDGYCDITGVYKVANTQVLGSQEAAVANVTGGSFVDTEARTALNSLLAKLRTHGIIAT